MIILKNIITCLLVILLLSIISPLNLSAQDYELYIAQGIQKLNEERYGAALAVLRRALKLSPDNPEATYYTGVAYSRLGKYENAEELFLKTLRLDETAVNANLELGRVYYSKGQCDKARAYLPRFISQTENESLKVYARDLLKKCKKVVAKEKPFRLNVAAGWQHDSNVILEPSNPPVGTVRGRKEDTRAVTYITAGGTVFRTGPVKLKADYSFYQNLHVHLEEFNLQYYKVAPAFVIDITDAIYSTAGYSLEYTLQGNELYSRVHTFQGTVTVKESENLATEAVYEYGDLKYWDTDLYTTNSLRRGHQNTAGIKQKFYLKSLSANIYGLADFKRAKARHWSYDGYRAGAKAVYRIIPPLSINVSGEFNRRKHKAIAPGATRRRIDEMQKYYVRLTYTISQILRVTIMDSFTVNDSNFMDYDYERNIAGIFLKAGVL